MNIHQFRGRVESNAQSKIASGNQNGEAHARLNDIPK